MSKVAIVYWSGTGNTEQMAESVADGARNAGADVTTFTAAEFDADKMDEFDAIAFGCPSMGAEQLEEDEWMRNWDETCRNDGAVMACDFVICNDAPDEDAKAACEELGKALA